MSELTGHAGFHEPDDEEGCPNCGGEGLVWGCFEDTCVCTDDDGLGCAPSRCDWCRPAPKPEARPAKLAATPREMTNDR